jgi:PAS domain-containing protein
MANDSMNLLTGNIPANRNQAASPAPRTLLLSARPDSFAAFDQGLAAIGRPAAERALDAAEATRLLRAGGIDLLMVDLVREGTTHLTAIEAVCGDGLLSGVVCIAISADPESTPTQKAIEIGIDDLLREPLDRNVVRLCVSACLERQRLRDDALQYWMATADDEADDHARCLLDALPDAVVALRPDGAIELANAMAERMFGLNGPALIGTPFFGLVSRAVDDGQGATWSMQALENLRGPALAILRLPGGFSRPVEILANPYQRFGRHLTACVLREVDWGTQKATMAQAEGTGSLRANAELLQELAKEVTTRLDVIGRNLNMMTDEVFGPVGVAIYKSYLSEAMTGVGQARALLDGAAHPQKERRAEGGAQTSLRDLAAGLIDKRRTNSERRRVVLELEIEPEGLTVSLPERPLARVIEALLDFALACVEHGGQVTLRGQCGSEEQLLLTVQTSGCSKSAADVQKATREPTDKKAAQNQLTIAWSALRAASKVLGGAAELDVGDTKGAMLVAMLPQRRRSDQG